jgi:prepilin-type N-terminal cleavage/methylation domain-containing protein
MNSPRPQSSALKGFTLIELLVVIAVIAMLHALLLPALRRGRMETKDIGCVNNLRQMAAGSLMYAHDSNGSFCGSTFTHVTASGGTETPPPSGGSDRSGSDDDLNWLYYGGYVKNLNTFICPQTRNQINPTSNVKTAPAAAAGQKYLLSLCDNANTLDATPFQSYECFGNYGHSPTVADSRTCKKSEKTSAVFTILNSTRVLKGTVVGPSRTAMILDGDDANAILDPNDLNNWPDSRNDNHGDRGAVMQFCDGHAAFIKQRDYDDVMNLSGDGSVNHLNLP